MTMRAATIEDVPAIVALGELMHAESPHFAGLAWDADKVARTVAHLIDSPRGFVQVVEREGQIVGGVMALAVEHWSSSDLTACDLAVFIHPERRGGMLAARLLTAYRQWAEGLGCKLVQFGILTGVAVEQTEGLAVALGWKRQGVVLCV